MNLIFGVLAGLLAAAPAAVTAGDDDRQVVIATTSIWADIVDQLDCTDTFRVETLIPLGGDAHSYEPSVRDRETLGQATLVVANGAGLEQLLQDTLDAVAADGTPVIEVADHVTTSPPGAHTADDRDDHDDHDDHDEHDDHDDHDHDQAGVDPHVWFDPTLVIEALPALGDALVAAGADRAAIDECAADLAAELAALDAEVEEILDVVPAERRLLVTNHDSLGYFARRYGFEILGSVLPGASTLAESSPGEIAELADAIEAAGIPAIFAEALESADEATTLGERLGVDVVRLFTGSLGEDGSGAETYADLMRFNADAVAAALSG